MTAQFGFPVEGTPPGADVITEKVEAYCKFLSEGDVDGILSLFTDDVLFFDPVGLPPRRGHADVRPFFEASAGKVELRTEGPIRIAGFYAAAPMRARAHGFAPNLFVDTLDVIVFTQDAKMKEFYAFWGATNNPSPNLDWA